MSFPSVSVFRRAWAEYSVLFLKYEARLRCGGGVVVLVFVCMVCAKAMLSLSVASAVGLGVVRDASEAPKRPSWFGHRGWGVVVPVCVGVRGWAFNIMSFSASAAADMLRIPVRDNLSSVSVASVLNSQVAIGSKLLLGPFPFVPSGVSFHMESVSVKIDVSVSVVSGLGDM